MNPLVSILIPVYNRVNLVSETIESALKQTYRNIEIVIVDNCSTDGTWDLLKDYALKDDRIRIFQNEENIGPVRNWKRCIVEAKGDYSKILFSDDLISDNFIDETLKIFDNKSAFVLASVNVFGRPNIDICKYLNLYKLPVDIYLNDILLINSYGFPVSPGAALFRTRDLLDSLEIQIQNPLDLDFPRFGAGNDLLLFLNTSLKYNYIKISNRATAFFRSHDDSFTISNKLNIYYDYAKYYFAKSNSYSILSKMKSILMLRNFKNLRNNSVYFLINERVSIIFIFYIIYRKFLNFI